MVAVPAEPAEPAILPMRLSGALVRRKGGTTIGPIDHELGTRGFSMVIGPNGAGKTTLLRMMHGLERLNAGRLRWQVPEEIARRHQAYVFQTPVMMRRSALDNVAYALTVHGVGRRAARSAAGDWLARVGLAGLADRSATVLSGGERQKLALARALVRRPQILFLDEPCANLDGRAVREIETILQAAHAGGTRIVMSTHDMGQARRLAGDVMFVYRGQVHEAAPAEVFFSGPATPAARAFLNGDIVE